MVGLGSEEMAAALRRVRELSEACQVASAKRVAANEAHHRASLEHEALSEQYLQARNVLWKLLSGVPPDSD